MQKPTNNRITQGQHGTSKAVDHSASPDPTIYSPVDGVVDSFMQRGSGQNDAGLMLRIKNTSTGAMHSFAHCELAYVKPGQTVKKGQPVAKMGHTGYTIPSGPAGRHVHYYIRLANGSYIYPPSIYSANAPSQSAPTNQGEDMITSKDVGTVRILMSEVEGWNGHSVHAGKHDKEIMGAWVGKSWIELINHGWKVQPVHRIHLTEQLVKIQKALANEKAKPAVEVIKEVDRIVQVPVEVIVETEPTWLKTAVDFIRSVLRIK